MKVSHNFKRAAAGAASLVMAASVFSAGLAGNAVSVYASTGSYTAASYANFSTAEQKAYNAVKAQALKIANGQESSTEVTLSGLTADEANAIMSSKKFLTCLLYDCPYEFYWFEKTSSTSISVTSYVTSASVTIMLPPMSAYKGSGDYTVDTSKTAAAASAMDNAKALISANAGKSDYEKLTAYKDYICAAVEYDTAAASSNTVTKAHQLINVFDNDSSTNVVCEGYSKAFQYLCDNSSFNGNIQCYSVVGTMSGGTGAGNHMWNIVSINGTSYLVDVTNIDGNAIGNPDKLFLKGIDGSVAAGYTKSVNGMTYKLTYSTTETIGIYPNSVLTLSASDYTPSDDDSANTDTDNKTDTDNGSESTDTDDKTNTDNGSENTDTDDKTNTDNGSESTDTDDKTNTDNGSESTDTDDKTNTDNGSESTDTDDKTNTDDSTDTEETDTTPVVTPVVTPAVTTYSITSDSHVALSTSSAAAGTVVSAKVSYGYIAYVYNANGKLIAKLTDSSSSFVMPIGGVTIQTEISADSMPTYVYPNSYIYSYDSDMNKIAVNGSRKGISGTGKVTVKLGSKYAGKTAVLYSGRKSTSHKLDEAVLDSSGNAVFTVEGGKNFTVVVK